MASPGPAINRQREIRTANRSGILDMATLYILFEFTSVLNRYFTGVPLKGTPAVNI